MRSDLDAVRERHVQREVREELLRVSTGDWGWAKAYVQTVPHQHVANATTDARARYVDVRGRQLVLEPLRPGTSDGGF
jgi:hypothetical protein